MEAQEFKDALDALKTDLEGKSKQEVKDAIEAFEQTLDSKFEGLIKSEELEAKFADLENSDFVKKMQEHLDKLDVKVNKPETRAGKSASYVSEMQKALEQDFDKIKEVGAGQKHKFELKAVADMTTSNNLTGSVVETYQPGLSAVPGQAVNFQDLVPTVQSATGVYVLYREALGEGSISVKTEGSAGTQIDFDYTKVTFNAQNIFGFSRFSSEMAQDLPFLQSTLPFSLSREYFKVENSNFYTALSTAATASTQIITGKNKIEMLMNELATLEGVNFNGNGIVMGPADYWDILQTEKSTGAGYGLPGVVTVDANGQLRVAGIPIFRANWLAANKYLVGDWSQAKKVSVQGLSVEFFEQDSDNVTKDLITARVKQRTVLGIDRPDAFIFGDFTAS